MAGYKQGFPGRTRDSRKGFCLGSSWGFVTARKKNVGGVARAQAEWAVTKAYHKEISLVVSPGHCWR